MLRKLSEKEIMQKEQESIHEENLFKAERQAELLASVESISETDVVQNLLKNEVYG